MAMASIRSGLLRTALRGGSRAPAPPKRNFSSSAHHDDAYETAKWEKITYAGIVTCTVLAIFNLSKGHPHHDEPPTPHCSPPIILILLPSQEKRGNSVSEEGARDLRVKDDSFISCV
ncbi:hypothetical protein L484_007758 [Morus notabilis]|uniref:Cytochrome c oxidase subunit 6a n=1 Tax=Morus notabilis TaxID=981085 RepID=W9RKC6_9ROSA|nr:hypothetical protein L484_007758 [Morus notabilis]